VRLGERRRLRRWQRGHACADGRADGYARADGHALSRLPLSDGHARADEYAEAYRHEHAAPTDGDAHEDANGDTHETANGDTHEDADSNAVSARMLVERHKMQV